MITTTATRLLFFQIMFIIFDTAKSDPNCANPNATFYGGLNKCFWYSNYGMYDIFDGEDFCEATGGHLATIDDQPLLDFLANASLNNVSGEECWIGINNVGDIHTWATWYMLSVAWANWDTGQPIAERCVRVDLSSWKWHATMCNSSSPYVSLCEAYATPGVTCPELNGFQYGTLNRCFWWGKGYSNAHSAHKFCEMTGGTLATIDDTTVYTALKDSLLSMGNGTFFWIDVNDRRQEGVWVTWYGRKVEWFSWSSDEPDNTESITDRFYGNCVVMETETGDWFDESCSGSPSALKALPLCNMYLSEDTRKMLYENPTEYFITEAANATCGRANSVYYQPLRKCYWRNSDYTDAIEAEAFCADTGGTLANMENSAVADFIELNLINDTICRNYWIGINDKNFEGTWKWNGKVVTWTSWNSNRIHNFGQQCIAVRAAKKVWNDRRCDSTIGISLALCEEISFHCTHTFPNTPTHQFAINNSCYYGWDTTEPYNTAKSVCEDGGTHLVFIETIAEGQAIFSHCEYEQVWLGLEKVSSTNWQWTGNGVVKTVTDPRWENEQDTSTLTRAKTVNLKDRPDWTMNQDTERYRYICEADGGLANSSASQESTTILASQPNTQAPPNGNTNSGIPTEGGVSTKKITRPLIRTVFCAKHGMDNLAAKMKNVSDELYVNRKDTHKYKSRFSSSSDNRPFAVTTGSFGAMLIASTICFVLFLDLIPVPIKVKQFRRKSRPKKEKQKQKQRQQKRKKKIKQAWKKSFKLGGVTIYQL